MEEEEWVALCGFIFHQRSMSVKKKEVWVWFITQRKNGRGMIRSGLGRRCRTGWEGTSFRNEVRFPSSVENTWEDSVYELKGKYQLCGLPWQWWAVWVQEQRMWKLDLMELDVASEELQRWERQREYGCRGRGSVYKGKLWHLTWAKGKGSQEVLTGSELVMDAKEWQASCGPSMLQIGYLNRKDSG